MSIIIKIERTSGKSNGKLLYSYLVGCCPLSDLLGIGEPILAKRKLSPLTTSSCQINQISDKQPTK